MRFHLSLAIGFSALLMPAARAQMRDTHALVENGERIVFEVARGEMHVGREPKALAAQASAEAVRNAARGSGGELVLYPQGSVRDESTRRLLTKELAVKIAPGVNAATLAGAGVRVVRSFGPQKRWWLVEAGPEPGSALLAAPLLRALSGVEAVEVQLARKRSRRDTTPNDPFFPKQWHLKNTGQNGGSIGVDVNISSVWDQYKGQGIVIGIIDDGLEGSHPDLADGYQPALSYDFNFKDTNPDPPAFSGDQHGTSCAGVAAARGGNGRGVAGAAYMASLAGLRLIAKPTSDADEAAAFQFENDEIHIKSNSWGPFDNGRILQGAGPLSRAAIEDAVANGRGGRGTIFTWAGGNGRAAGDDSNFDGFANLPETIAVGALGNDGKQASYSENGANLLVVAPSSSTSGTLSVTTVDRKGIDGYNSGNSVFDLSDNNYTQTFGGTSSACPLVAGCVALMLQANPNLGWRDVQEILIRSARKIDANDADWANNSAGFHFNHRYGAGLIDTAAAVELALGWTNLRSRLTASSEQTYVAEPIPDGQASGVEHEFLFDDDTLRVEHVTVTVDARHSSRGQLRIELESPSGMRSVLAPARARDKGNHYKKVTFSSVRHWGESAAGTWKVRVSDNRSKVRGTLVGLKVDLFGAQKPTGVEASGWQVVAEADPDGFIRPDERVGVQFSIRNTTSNPLDAGLVSLESSAGVADPDEPQAGGIIAPGQTAKYTFAFTAKGVAGDSARARLRLGNSLGALSYMLPLGVRPTEPQILTSSQPLLIPGAGTKGDASFYPSSILGRLMGLPLGSRPAVTGVTVRLKQLQHQKIEDLDILLVHPTSGQSVVLMSDAGLGAFSGDLVFSDSATARLDSSAIVPGTYKPTNLGATLDSFGKGAPRPPFGSALSRFNGATPYDLWQLYIRDDSRNFTGRLEGWELELQFAY